MSKFKSCPFCGFQADYIESKSLHFNNDSFSCLGCNTRFYRPNNKGPMSDIWNKRNSPHEFSRDKEVKRRDDMSETGTLILVREPDGDILLSIIKYEDESNNWADLEFCSVGNGGGRSSHTMKALHMLMVAIEKDNKEKPIKER